jgi:hypothetical protein
MPLAQISSRIIVFQFWGKDIEIVEVLGVESFNCWWERVSNYEKCVFLQRNKERIVMEDFVLSIPTRDQSFMETLAARMCWKLLLRRASIEQFIKSCPQTPVITEEEIAAEVNAVRYEK